jgi:hypothetical protein
MPRSVRGGPLALTVLRVRAARGRTYGALLTPGHLLTLRA